jgi:hypothetical protein
MSETKQETIVRTVHNHSCIIHKTMYHIQRLCDSDTGLVLIQAVQSLKHSLDLSLSEQLLCELLYSILYLATPDLYIMIELTKSPLSDLLRCQSKHRK